VAIFPQNYSHRAFACFLPRLLLYFVFQHLLARGAGCGPQALASQFQSMGSGIMQKAKATKRPNVNKKIDYILRPNRIRMGLIYALTFAIAMAIGILIRFFLDGGVFSPDSLFGDWSINLLIVIGGAVLFALLDYSRWTIRIVDGDKLEGPTGAFGDRHAFPIRDIDWNRTGRSLGSRFKIGNGIYTTKRQRILISPWFYNPEEYQQFTAMIGYKQA
jgi:hypothetical protein